MENKIPNANILKDCRQLTLFPLAIDEARVNKKIKPDSNNASIAPRSYNIKAAKILKMLYIDSNPSKLPFAHSIREKLSNAGITVSDEDFAAQFELVCQRFIMINKNSSWGSKYKPLSAKQLINTDSFDTFKNKMTELVSNSNKFRKGVIVSSRLKKGKSTLVEVFCEEMGFLEERVDLAHYKDLKEICSKYKYASKLRDIKMSIDQLEPNSDSKKSNSSKESDVHKKPIRINAKKIEKTMKPLFNFFGSSKQKQVVSNNSEVRPEKCFENNKVMTNAGNSEENDIVAFKDLPKEEIKENKSKDKIDSFFSAIKIVKKQPNTSTPMSGFGFKNKNSCDSYEKNRKIKEEKRTDKILPKTSIVDMIKKANNKARNASFDDASTIITNDASRKKLFVFKNFNHFYKTRYLVDKTNSIRELQLFIRFLETCEYPYVFIIDEQDKVMFEELRSHFSTIDLDQCWDEERALNNMTSLIFSILLISSELRLNLEGFKQINSLNHLVDRSELIDNFEFNKKKIYNRLQKFLTADYYDEIVMIKNIVRLFDCNIARVLSFFEISTMECGIHPNRNEKASNISTMYEESYAYYIDYAKSLHSYHYSDLNRSVSGIIYEFRRFFKYNNMMNDYFRLPKIEKASQKSISHFFKPNTKVKSGSEKISEKETGLDSDNASELYITNTEVADKLEEQNRKIGQIYDYKNLKRIPGRINKADISTRESARDTKYLDEKDIFNLSEYERLLSSYIDDNHIYTWQKYNNVPDNKSLGISFNAEHFDNDMLRFSYIPKIPLLDNHDEKYYFNYFRYAL